MKPIFFFCCFIYFLPAFAGLEWNKNEDGYSLWLRYNPVENKNRQKTYSRYFRTITVAEESPTLEAIKAEFSRACEGFFSTDANFISSSRRSKNVEIVLVKQHHPSYRELGNLNHGSYKIISNKRRHKITLMSTSEDGLLYGTFHLLRLLQNGESLDNLHITESPKLHFRMLNQWDNLDGTIERGYSGTSIYQWDELPDIIDGRYEDLARANASIGINAICINSVNANPNILRPEYLEKVSKLADIFRPYKIRIFLSPNFSAPMEPSSNPHAHKRWGGIGNLKTNDPLNKDVIAWWENKIKEIYDFIPDFGGFVIKANSEGMPGPQDYGRSHAEGANMFASLLEPYNGIVVWRAFVYGAGKEPDRIKHAYQEFYPLDGKFNENVFLQVKNGPLDFQPSEPAHPLFGATKKTFLMPELQITQEYLGHSTYLVYLGPMWKDFLDFDTFSPIQERSRIADLIQKPYKAGNMTGMTGVLNVGSDRNWTGHHFAQANWYLFGRLAWDPNADIDTITREWIKMTWTEDEQAINIIQSIMDTSWKNFTDLQTPFGLPVTTDRQHHYSPALSLRNNTYWRADKSGIGYDRSTTGSDYVSQYFPKNRDKFNNIESCPEDLLLFFHFIQWDHILPNNRTLYDTILDYNKRSVQNMKNMKAEWSKLKDKIDPQRHSEVLSRMEKQVEDAIIFNGSYIDFFNKVRK